MSGPYPHTYRILRLRHIHGLELDVTYFFVLPYPQTCSENGQGREQVIRYSVVNAVEIRWIRGASVVFSRRSAQLSRQPITQTTVVV